jgi:serine/alanine adding enzyme
LTAEVETLGAGDPRWDELVDDSPTPDVYYRPGYCAAYEAAGHGRLVAVETEGALFPLLLRALPFGEDGLDAATPYGYGGVLLTGSDPVRPLTGSDPVKTADLHQLREWCAANGVVSCLLRLHPLLGGSEQLSQSDVAEVEIREYGPTTAVDPRRIDEATGRLTGMSKGRKADLTIARRELELVWATGEDALESFRVIYDGTMRRLGADEFYLFPTAYYRTLADGLGERLGVALALREDEPVGGALFLADRRFAHYHLSGTADAGRELKAGTLLVHAGAEWARDRGSELLHLGGGTSGSHPLYAFKKSFGGETFTYSFATLVADRDRYDELVARRSEETAAPRPGFFPAYRA